MQLIARRFRIALIPIAVAACGFSFAQLLYRRVFRSSTMDPQDKLRLSRLWGFGRPEMEPHYERFLHPESAEYDSLFDTLKNLPVEHCREFSSTAAKMYGFLLMVSLIVGAVGWVL